MAMESDLELMLRVRAGDAASYETLLRRYRLPRLRKKAVAAASCRHLALKSLELWRGKPAATPRPATFSADCSAGELL
jgi:hypothetical protein